MKHAKTHDPLPIAPATPKPLSDATPTPETRCHSLRPARLIKSTPKLSRRLNSQAKRTQPAQTVVIRHVSDATDAHKRSRGTDHATIGKQTRTTNTLNVLYKTDGTRYTCAQRTKVLFAFITPHNMCKLTLTRSKLRPDSNIARQNTYGAGEDRYADKHTAQTAQTRERRRLTTPKTHNLPRYSHATAKQTVCTL